MSWKTILVPHDFSASANHAAALARDEAKVHGARVLLLHVIELPSQLGPDIAIVPDATGAPVNLKDYALNSAEAHLTDLVDRLVKDGVSAAGFVRIGKPVDEILTFVGENEIDLIVMGTHGRTGLRRFVAGSVAERVVRDSDVPVLTVRHRE